MKCWMVVYGAVDCKSAFLGVEGRNGGADVETAQGGTVKVVTVLSAVGRHVTFEDW